MPKENKFQNLIVKTTASVPLKFPVSLKTFMKFTHYEDAVDKYVKQKWGKSSPEFAKQGLEKLYQAFYNNSKTRARECNLKIKACPKHIKEKLLQFAVPNLTLDLTANRNKLASKQVIPRKPSETDKINLNIKPSENPPKFRTVTTSGISKEEISPVDLCGTGQIGEISITRKTPLDRLNHVQAANSISVMKKLIKDKTPVPNCVVNESSAMEKKTSNNCSKLSDTLQYPVSLKTFIKYTDHRRLVTKYVEKYWEENPQAPRERTLTDDDIAKEGIKVLYKDFYRCSESRDKLNMRIKPCPDEIKDRLLKYAKLMEMEKDNDAEIHEEYQNNRKENENVQNISSKYVLRYPVSMESFIKYTNHSEDIDKYVNSCNSKNKQAMEGRTDEEVKKEALKMLYKDFYNSIESREKHNIQIKACPKRIKEKLLKFAQVVNGTAEDVSVSKLYSTDRKGENQPTPITCRKGKRLLEMDDNSQMKKCKKVKFAKQLAEKHKPTITPLNPIQTITNVPPRDNVRSTVQTLENVEDCTRNNAVKMQNETLSNNVNKNVTEKPSISRQTLRYPVSLKTFIKYTDHKKHVTKYMEKYWEQNPQAPIERTRTDNDVAKEGIKEIYKDFYRCSESRAKLNMRIKPCPEDIKNRLLQYAELIVIDVEGNAQMGQIEKTLYANELGLQRKVQSNFVENYSIPAGNSPTTTSVAAVEIVNPGLTPVQEGSVVSNMKQTSIESWLIKGSNAKKLVATVNLPQTEVHASPRKDVKSTTTLENRTANSKIIQIAEMQNETTSSNVNPPQTIMQVSPRMDVRSTTKSIEDGTANCKIKEAIEMQNETSSNHVNENVIDICRLPKQSLRYPVSLETFMKYTDHSRHVTKYVEKYLSKNAQISGGKTRTDEEMAKHVIKMLYKAFYKNSKSRAKLNIRIKPCPNKIKDKLLQYAEVIEMEDNNRKQSNNTNNENENLCILNKNDNRADFSSESNLRYPVSFQTFIKYTHINEAADNYVDNYWNVNTQSLDKRSDEDIKNEALEILYKDFYNGIESRAKHNVKIKACPKHVKEKLLRFAELVNANEKNVSNLKATQAAISNKNFVDLANPPLINSVEIKDSTVESVKVGEIENSRTVNSEKVNAVKESTGIDNDKLNEVKQSKSVNNDKLNAVKESSTVDQDEEVNGTKETTTMENEKACQPATSHKCSTPQKLTATQTKVTYFRNENSLTDEFLVHYIKSKLGDSTKHAAEILARIKKEVLLKTIEVPKSCTAKPDKVHIQSVRILKPSNINKDLQEAKELFFQKLEKHHTLPYIIRMNDGLKGDILSAVLDMSFSEFSKYTHIHNAHIVYNDLPTLRRFYEFALIEHKIWPINLYMRLNSLFEYLAMKGVHIKLNEKFNLAPISPKLLRWQDIISVTNYDECVLRYYEEPGESLSDEYLANRLREDYYRKCWIHEQWIVESSVLNIEVVLNLNASATVDWNKTKTQLENDIEMQLETYNQENVDIEINDIGDWGVFIDMQSKDLNETMQPQLENDTETGLDIRIPETAGEENTESLGDWGIFREMQSRVSHLCKKLPTEAVAVELSRENFIDMPNTQVQIDALPTETHVNSDPLSADTLENLNEYVEISEAIGNASAGTSGYAISTVKKEPLDNILFMLDDKEENFQCFALPEIVIAIDEGEIQNSNSLQCMDIEFDVVSSPPYSVQELSSIPSASAGEDLGTFCEAQRLPSTLEEQAEQQVKNNAFHITNKTATAKESDLAAAATKAIAMPITNLNMPAKTFTNTKSGQMVPQLTHGFRALPLTKVLKNVNMSKRYVTPSETIARLDTTSTATTSTCTASSFSVSQALATNCTLFESSQLHRAIEEHQVQAESVISHVPQKTSNSLATASSTFKSSSAHQVNELNELYPFTSHQVLLYRSLEKFYYFEQLSYGHIAKHLLQTASVYERYMGAVINVNGHKTQLYGDCLNLIFPYYSPKLLADIRLVLKNIRMYHYNVFERKTYRNLSDDLRKRILCYLIDSTPMFLDTPVYLKYDSTCEIGHCIPIVSNTAASLGRDSNNRPSLGGAIKPEIRNRIMQLKKNMC